MLRTLGSSLVAKSRPGTKLREVTEARIATPPIPQKGQVGTLSRAQIEEPLTRQVPPGSEKIVSVQPTVEGTTVPPAMVTPPVAPLPTGMGVEAAPSISRGAQAQALFQGGVGTPAGKVAQARPAVGVSRPGTGAAPAVGIQPSTGEQTSQQGEVVPKTFKQEPWTSGMLGLHSYAGEEGTQTSRPRNTGQALAGIAANIIGAVAGRNNPTATNLRSFAEDPRITLSGRGSISRVLEAGDKFAKYVWPYMGSKEPSLAKDVGQKVGNIRSQVSSKLRSLFKR